MHNNHLSGLKSLKVPPSEWSDLQKRAGAIRGWQRWLGQGDAAMAVREDTAVASVGSVCLWLCEEGFEVGRSLAMYRSTLWLATDF